MALIEDNRALCGEDNRCQIIRDNVERALARPIQGGPFDIIVLDPPYDYSAVAAAVRDAASQRNPGAVLVLEHASRVTPPAPAGLTVTRTIALRTDPNPHNSNYLATKRSKSGHLL